jgi:hypothetical protein
MRGRMTSAGAELNQLYRRYADAVASGRADSAATLKEAMFPLCVAVTRRIRGRFPSDDHAGGDRFHDVIVEKFLQLTGPDQLDRFHGDNFAAYFCKAVQNRMLQAARPRRRDRACLPLDGDGRLPGFAETVPAKPASPAAALTGDLRRALRRALRRQRAETLVTYCDYLEEVLATGNPESVQAAADRRRISFQAAFHRIRSVQEHLNAANALVRDAFGHDRQELGDLAELIPELRCLIDERRRHDGHPSHAGRHVAREAESARER